MRVARFVQYAHYFYDSLHRKPAGARSPGDKRSTRGWYTNVGDWVMSHVKGIGDIIHVVILSDEGQPLWDQWLFFEGVGAITLPVNKKGEIGLVQVARPLLRDMAGYVYRGADLSELGKYSWELPRGMPYKDERPEQTAAREGGEELGSPVKVSRRLGNVSPNTKYFPVQQPLFLAEIDEEYQGPMPADVNEKILRVEWTSRHRIDEMIDQGLIFCGFTLSGLALYDSYLRRHARLPITLG